MSKVSRRDWLAGAGTSLLALDCSRRVGAQSGEWAPSKTVELVVPTAAGSTMDQLARIIQDVWQKSKLVEKPVIVQVRSGGGGAVAWSYVGRQAGDGHFLAISGPTLLSQEVLGAGDLTWRDVTPIAQLFTEYTGFAVNIESPIKSGGDLVASMRGAKPPSIGVAPGFGGSNHVALLKLARAAGIKSADLTIVPFKGANESVTAVLGGHIDATIGTIAVLAPMIEAGKLRLVAVAAPQRLGGALSGVPTWRELGFDVVEGNWRGVVGPKGLKAAESAFWSDRLRRVTETEEWRRNLALNYWNADYKDSAGSARFLEVELEQLRATLATLKEAK